MSTVNVKFDYEPEPDEVDEDDSTGLTEDAHSRLLEDLMQLGATNIDVSA